MVLNVLQICCWTFHFFCGGGSVLVHTKLLSYVFFSHFFHPLTNYISCRDRSHCGESKCGPLVKRNSLGTMREKRLDMSAVIKLILQEMTGLRTFFMVHSGRLWAETDGCYWLILWKHCSTVLIHYDAQLSRGRGGSKAIWKRSLSGFANARRSFSQVYGSWHERYSYLIQGNKRKYKRHQFMWTL